MTLPRPAREGRPDKLGARRGDCRRSGVTTLRLSLRAVSEVERQGVLLRRRWIMAAAITAVVAAIGVVIALNLAALRGRLRRP